jgi:hypothetical protein
MNHSIREVIQSQNLEEKAQYQLNKGTIGKKIIPPKLTESKLLGLLYTGQSSQNLPSEQDSVYEVAYQPNQTSAAGVSQVEYTQTLMDDLLNAAREAG